MAWLWEVRNDVWGGGDDVTSDRNPPACTTPTIISLYYLAWQNQRGKNTMPACLYTILPVETLICA